MTSEARTPYCIFCEIIAGREPADIWHQDDEYIVFRNQLRWLPIMLLIVPKKHMTQDALWSDIGRAGKLAVALGNEHASRGFRLLSNFGRPLSSAFTSSESGIAFGRRGQDSCRGTG